ncbi:MAG: fatty acid--CoA ligase family protein [Steroidobacteraceae bacterium]
MLQTTNRKALVAALTLAREREWQLLLLPACWSKEKTAQSSRTFRPIAILNWSEPDQRLIFAEGPGGAEDLAQPGIVLFTSGTTGTPKAVSHSWRSITACTGFVPERLRGLIWYSGYQPISFAGLQMFFSASESQGVFAVSSAGSSFQHQARHLSDARATIVSGAPTWWRMLIAAWPSGVPKPALDQATLGGEIVDQATLDLVRAQFSPGRLTHVYASSEAGTAIAVSDGLAGFPCSVLASDREVRLRLVDGELEVQSPYSMRGYLGAQGEGPLPQTQHGSWVKTGDLVELRGDRHFFTGRKDGRMNVGGLKVSPEEVEAAVLDCPDVVDCVVYGKSSPIVGTILCADVVPRRPNTFDSAAIRRHLQSCLPLHKVPRIIRAIDAVRMSAAGKKLRIELSDER